MAESIISKLPPLQLSENSNYITAVKDFYKRDYEFLPKAEDGFDMQMTSYKVQLSSLIAEELNTILQISSESFDADYDLDNTRISFVHRSNIDSSKSIYTNLTFCIDIKLYAVYLDVYNKATGCYEQFSLDDGDTMTEQNILGNLDDLFAEEVGNGIMQSLMCDTYNCEEYKIASAYIQDNDSIQEHDRFYTDELDKIQELKKNLHDNIDTDTIEIIDKAEESITEEAANYYSAIAEKMSVQSESVDKTFSKPMPDELKSVITSKTYESAQISKQNHCKRLADKAFNTLGKAVKNVMDKAKNYKCVDKLLNVLNKVSTTMNSISMSIGNVIKKIKSFTVQNETMKIMEMENTAKESTDILFKNFKKLADNTKDGKQSQISDKEILKAIEKCIEKTESVEHDLKNGTCSHSDFVNFVSETKQFVDNIKQSSEIKTTSADVMNKIQGALSRADQAIAHLKQTARIQTNDMLKNNMSYSECIKEFVRQNHDIVRNISTTRNTNARENNQVRNSQEQFAFEL